MLNPTHSLTHLPQMRFSAPYLFFGGESRPTRRKFSEGQGLKSRVGNWFLTTMSLNVTNWSSFVYWIESTVLCAQDFAHRFKKFCSSLPKNCLNVAAYCGYVSVKSSQSLCSAEPVERTSSVPMSEAPPPPKKTPAKVPDSRPVAMETDDHKAMNKDGLQSGQFGFFVVCAYFYFNASLSCFILISRSAVWSQCSGLCLKGPWTPKLTYTFYPFSWKCRIFW